MNTETVLHFERLLLPGGWQRDVRLVLEDGLIVSITPDAAPRPGDKRHAIGLPGMPNLHSHAFQRGMAGAAEYRGGGKDSFWTWRQAMYRFVDRLDPEAMLAIAALAYMEMLEAGFTRVGEFHYLHHDPAGHSYEEPARMAAALAEAAAETGIALTLLPVFYAQAGFGGLPASPRQRRFVTDPESYARLLDASRHALAGLHDVRLGIAPHSLRAVTPAALAEVTALGHDGPVHIHIAEQQREVDDCLAWSGARPVQWLLDNAEVGPDWCLVHATHVNEAEWRGMIRSGAIAGLCPMTEANLGDGIFPAAATLAGGLGFGIGSDSNVRIDMTEELRLLEYGQRLSHHGRNCLTEPGGGSTGRFLYHGGVAGGSQALAAPAPLAPGSPADLVSLRADAPSLIGRSDDALLDAFVFSAGQGAIESVWRRGCRIVRDGRHVRRGAIVDHFAATLKRLAQ